MLSTKKDTKVECLGRAHLIEQFCQQHHLDKNVAADILETILKTLTETFVKGKTLKIAGFASFSVHGKTARPGRNPRTGQSTTIPARRVVRLRSSALFHKRLNHEV